MELTVTQQERPWDRPFWKPVRGKEAVFAYIVLIHVLAVVGLIPFPIPSLKVVGMSLLSIAYTIRLPTRRRTSPAPSRAASGGHLFAGSIKLSPPTRSAGRLNSPAACTKSGDGPKRPSLSSRSASV